MVRRGSITATLLVEAAVTFFVMTGGASSAATGPTSPLPLGPGPVVFSWIAGTVRLCGGPAPGGCHVESITSCGPEGCIRADRARILRAGATVDTVRLKKGRFKLTVSPGSYVVQLLGDGPHAHARVLQHKRVVAKRYATARVTFTIAVP